MTGPVSMRRDGEIAVIEIDSPPVNALSHPVRAGIAVCMAEALADDSVKGVALTCLGRTFCAGADITEFDKPPMAPMLTEVINTIEASPKPVVAALHGTALGGGFELPLGCHFRVAAPSAAVGLPEVKLGILPGAGGTQRLPRLIGLEAALQRIVTGAQIPAQEALALGAVDEIIEGDLTAGALAFLRSALAENHPLRPTRDRNDKTSNANLAAFDALSTKLTAKSRGLKAPAMCAESVRNAATMPFDDALQRERQIFETLRDGDQSKAQRHIFFAERAAQKIEDMPRGTKGRPITQAAVLGAGAMGGGIAMCFADAGLPVTLIDQSEEAVGAGVDLIRANYQRSATSGRVSEAEMAQRLALITPSTTFADVATADIVIEAVFEDMALKKRLFADLDAACKPGAILATNTSTLDVDAIAAATQRPQDVLGLHFFSPANVMRLLEIVRAQHTTHDVLKTAIDLGRKMGKAPVTVGVCHGFVGNRMLHARGRQVEQLLLEGATPTHLDAALTNFGFPMGPCAMSDLAGLDVSWRVRREAGLTAAVADAICERGWFGQKTSRGYFRYEQGSRRPVADPEVEALISTIAQTQNAAPRAISEREVFERLVFPMINEAADILAEGVAARASDIDVVWVFGYGWPIGTGGPMRYAETLGVKAIFSSLMRYSDQTEDPSLAPGSALTQWATSGEPPSVA
ncbi:MAG: enoyl-CoA hydratase/isomerase family protein [Rhodobacteraceae bacterium]|nr:enoyl-CoA hydratase/isomerase family protein [Paracoccaceae bacterium]